MTQKRTRITMTAAQRASAAGAELLVLLVDITRDGELTEEEVARLGHWLVDNEEATRLPAVGFLRDIVTRVVDDCRLDADEVLDLACAIERVLPKEQRLFAKDRRERAEDAAAALGRAAGNRELATPPQLKYLRALGVVPPEGMTKEQASDTLDRLLRSRASVSNRQMMVLRFWNHLTVAERGRYGVSEWMDLFYEEDRDRPAAWEWWKEENGDCGHQEPPEKVPIGIGPNYLARVKQRLLERGRS